MWLEGSRNIQLFNACIHIDSLNYLMFEKPKKKYSSFLSEESINAVLDLTNFYDYMMVNYNKNIMQMFMNEIMPLLDIVRDLFGIINTKKKLVMIYNFYTKLFQIKCPIFKQSN